MPKQREESELQCSKPKGFTSTYCRSLCGEKETYVENITSPSPVSAFYEQQFPWSEIQKESINKISMMHQEISPRHTHFESNEPQTEEVSPKPSNPKKN